MLHLPDVAKCFQGLNLLLKVVESKRNGLLVFFPESHFLVLLHQRIYLGTIEKLFLSMKYFERIKLIYNNT